MKGDSTLTMTFKQLLNAVPDTFKCIALSDRYTFQCRECSYKESKARSGVRASEWQSGWQLNLSETLETHQSWHKEHPNKSWEEHRKEILDKASRDAMAMLSKVFNKMMK